MSLIPGNTHPLVHLLPCPKCPEGTQGAFLSTPRMSKGREHDDNAGYWYQKCLNNHPPTHSTCTHFQWCMDIPKGPKGTISAKVCPGRTCQTSAKPGRANSECTFGLCLSCCQDAQYNVPALRKCTVSTHNAGSNTNTMSIATVPSTTILSSSESIQSGQHALPILSGVPSSSAKTLRTPVAKSYKLSVSPLYQQRLTDLEQEQIHSAAQTTGNAHHSRSNSKAVMIYWWHKDDTPAELLHILAAEYPWFHPKQAADLVEQFGVDKGRFQFYDWKVKNWVQGSPLSPSRNLKDAGDLHYRSIGVTQAPGMPTPTLKRTLDIENISGHGTLKRSMSMIQVKREREDVTLVDDSDEDGSLKRSASMIPVKREQEADIIIIDDSDDEDLATAIKHAAAPSQTVASSYLTSASPPTRIAKTLKSDVPSSPAPHGRHPWPLRYVVDMADGFDRIKSLEDQGSTRDAAFETVFGTREVRGPRSAVFRRIPAVNLREIPLSLREVSTYLREISISLRHFRQE